MWSTTVNIVFSIVFKFYHLIIRLLDFFRFFPVRLGRLIRHVSIGIGQLPKLNRIHPRQILFWWLEIVFYVLDLIGITEIVEILNDFIKFNSRPLHGWEIDLAKSVYGKSLNYRRIRIDEYAAFGPKQSRICYVFGFTINAWGKMHNSLLIHELTHIWQYQKIGLVYIPRALRAYHSEENYNYGGVPKLDRVRQRQGSIWDFNLEQQGDIIADYYRIKNRHAPNWGNGDVSDLALYEYFVQQLN